MLQFTSDEDSYIGIRTRMNDIISVFTTEVSTLVKCHNDDIRYNSPDNYFLDEDYIDTSFTPFNMNCITVTDNFTELLNVDNVFSVYDIQAQGRNIIFDKGADYYSLKFSAEDKVDNYAVKFNTKSNAMIYSYICDTQDSENCVEFIEIKEINKNEYALQSINERLYISFDEQGHIDYFYYSVLNNDSYSADLYDNGISGLSAKNWVSKGPDNKFIVTVEFKDGKLKLNDFSSGTKKSVTIEESDYAVAFYK